MSQKIQRLADESGKEINTSQIWEIFETNFLIPKEGFSYLNHKSSSENGIHHLDLNLNINGNEVTINGLRKWPY
jgi:2-isopropylmalate synthase